MTRKDTHSVVFIERLLMAYRPITTCNTYITRTCTLRDADQTFLSERLHELHLERRKLNDEHLLFSTNNTVISDALINLAASTPLETPMTNVPQWLRTSLATEIY